MSFWVLVKNKGELQCNADFGLSLGLVGPVRVFFGCQSAEAGRGFFGDVSDPEQQPGMRAFQI